MIKYLVVRTIQKSRTAFQLRDCIGTAQSKHTYIPRGLLGNTAEEYHITTNLKITDCYDLVKSRTTFQKAMEKDSMEFASLNIVKIGETLRADTVVGRSRALATLEDSYQCGGSFIVATGGCSVGKSKILNNVGKQTRLKVEQPGGYTLIVDGRKVDDKRLHTALFHELLVQNKELEMPLDLRICLHDAKGKKTPMALANLLNFITASKKESTKMIIIDEADRFFLSPATKENLRVTFKWKAQCRQIVQTLQTLQSFCKHLGDISVILCTSDSTFPIALAALGFTGTFNQWMVIAEPSPAETIETLRAWGVGENLALALVDVYGGHLEQIYRQLADMALWRNQPEYWDCAVSFGFADTAALLRCLDDARDMGPQLEQFLMRTLKTLAVTGFVPTRPQSHMYAQPMYRFVNVLYNICWLSSEEDLETQAVLLLTRHKIASYVPRAAHAEALPCHRADGLVPDTQFVRMLLLREYGAKWILEENEEKRRSELMSDSVHLAE